MEAFIFVDYTNLIHISSTKDKPLKMESENYQFSVTVWQKALEVTGRSPKEEKGFWYLILYKWVDLWPILQISEYEKDYMVDINNPSGYWSLV